MTIKFLEPGKDAAKPLKTAEQSLDLVASLIVRDYGRVLPSLGVCLRRVHRPAKHAALHHYLHLIGRCVICLVPFLWRQAFYPEKVAGLTTQECDRSVVGRVARAAHF